MQKKYLKNLTRGLKGLMMLALMTGLAYGGQRDARAAGIYTEPGSNVMTSNWAYPVKCHTIAQGNGNTMVIYSVLNEKKQQTLVLDLVNRKGERTNYRKLSIPGKTWGGTVYQAHDGCNYIITGNDGNIAYYILKYSAEWKLLGTASIFNNESYTDMAFYGGNSDMTLVGYHLIVHVARRRFNGHQSNATFYIDIRNMKPTYITGEFGFSHVSHSFSQFVRSYGNRVFMVDQGDAYPRGICFQTYQAVEGSLGLMEEEYLKRNLFQFWMEEGAFSNKSLLNYTGTTVDGFELGNKHHLVVGSSIPHDRFTSEQEYKNYKGCNNLYAILVNRDLKSSKLKWLTSYPSNIRIEKNVELIKIDGDNFIILYGIRETIDEENDVYRDYTNYVFIDSAGNIKKSGKIQRPFYCTSEPSIDSNELTWCHYVESELGHFMVLNRWNLNTGKFTVKNIDTGIPSKISKISDTGDMSAVYMKGKKIECSLTVFSKVFEKNYPTAPAVWQSSNEKVIQVLENESILSDVGSSSAYKEQYRYVDTHLLMKKEGTVTITCRIGDKKWSKKIRVVGKLAKPGKVKGLKIKNVSKGTVQASWKKTSPKATGYEIQYARKKNFKIRWAGEQKRTKARIKWLKNKKTYYFRVRAYRYRSVDGEEAYGSWSKVVKKKCR